MQVRLTAQLSAVRLLQVISTLIRTELKDMFTIVSHSISAKRGDRMTYISGLEDLVELKKQYPGFEMILQSDQGSVYTSKAYNELLPMYGITRSMSRAGTPTDNAAMESINGWIKAELFTDLHVTGEKSVQEEIDDYISFFNEQRQ